MENKEQKRIEQITGDKFREMIQSDESLQLGSESRFTHYMQDVSIGGEGKDPNEVIPVAIPSRKYRSNHWRTQSLAPTTEPYYEVTGQVKLGGIHNEIKIFPYGVEISDCRFIKGELPGPIAGLSIEYMASKRYVKFINCQFDDHFSVNNSTIERLEFINCQFYHQFTEFFDSNIENVILTDCSFKELNFSSSQLKILKRIELKNINCTILNLKGDYFGDLILNNLNSPVIKFEETYYNFEKKTFLPREKIFIKFLDLMVDRKNENSYEIQKVKTDTIRLAGHLNKQSILLRDIETKNFQIENFINEGQLRLHGVEIETNGSGKIIDSQLSKTEFNNVNFKLATSFQIYFSNLTEIITNNTHFPDRISARNKEDYQEVREIYRQLKYAATKQGDRIRESKYEQLEFIAHEKSLKGLKQLGNKLILVSNRISNNHGQDWVLPAFLLFSITIILFICTKSYMGYLFEFSYYPSSIDTSQYLNFALNPLHDFDKVFSIKNSGDLSLGKPKVLDAFAKIVSGYFIFQFLKAFRKYAK